jgi:peptide/nickel transport system substrate-binding protein/oligopeptide transport system substrate-binding protein
MTHARLGRAAAMLAVVAVLAGCSSADQPAASGSEGSKQSAGSDKPRDGGNLTVFASNDPATMDPALVSGYDQTIISSNVLEGLFRVTPDGQSVEPALAESAEASPDGKTWTIKLRKANFQDGTPVTAGDVVFSFTRLVDPATKSPRAQLLDIVQGASDFRKGSADSISGLQAEGDDTVTVTLSTPYAGFKALLASPNLAIVPKAAVEKDPQGFGRAPITAAPFQISNWKANESVTAKAFDGYWGGRPHLDTVTWKVVPDENTRMIEFEGNNMDITWLPPASYDKYANDSSWEDNLLRAETIHTEMFAVNMDRGPLGKSLDLRKAICEAVDRDAAIASLQGRATEALTLMPKSLEPQAPEPACSPDPAAAKKVFASSAPSQALQLISPNWGNLVKTLELYQANLKEAGLQVKLVPLEYAQYQARLDKGDFDLAWTYRVPDYIDADSFLTPLLSSDRIGFGNAARYSNSSVDQMLTEARGTMDEGQRATLYQQLSTQALKDLPYIPLVHNVWVDIHQPRVHDYVPSAMDMHNYRNVWVSQ